MARYGCIHPPDCRRPERLGALLAFIVRRLAQAVIVMLTVAFLAFMLFQYVGDPVAQMLGQDATQAQRGAL